MCVLSIILIVNELPSGLRFKLAIKTHVPKRVKNKPAYYYLLHVAHVLPKITNKFTLIFNSKIQKVCRQTSSYTYQRVCEIKNTA